MQHLAKALSVTLFTGLTLGAQGLNLGPSAPSNSTSLEWLKESETFNWKLYYLNAKTTEIKSETTKNPYFISNNPLNNDKRDFNTEDGWILVFKDFGTPEKAPHFPSFALYNRFNGKLRIAIYNSQAEAADIFKATISFWAGDSVNALNHTTANLTFTDNQRCFTNDFDPSKTEVLLGRAAKYGDWMFFDIPMIGYDPLVNSKQPKLDLELTSIKETTGTITMEGGLLLQQIRSGSAFPGGQNSNASIGSALKDGYKWYKDTKTWVDNELNNPKNKDEIWWDAAKSITSAWTGVAIGSFAPWAAGLAGFASNYFFGGANKQASYEPLNFKGKINLDGSIRLITNQYLWSEGLDLAQGAQTPSYYKPVQPITWGVFNVTEKPKVTLKKRLVRDWVKTGMGWVIKWCPRGYYAAIPTMPEIAINPEISGLHRSTKVAYTFPSSVPTSYTALPDQEMFVASCPTGISLELKFELPNPVVLDKDQVVYKTVPVSATVVGTFYDYSFEPEEPPAN